MQIKIKYTKLNINSIPVYFQNTQILFKTFVAINNELYYLPIWVGFKNAVLILYSLLYDITIYSTFSSEI